MDKVLVRQPVVDLRTGLPTPEWTSWFDQLTDQNTVQTTVREVITNIITSGGPTNPFAGNWSSLDKTGSSLADLTVRNASDLQGTMGFAQLPTGTGEWNANVLFSGNTTLTNPKIAGNYLLPAISHKTSIGAPFNKFLAIYAAELTVETLVAQDKVATVGGSVLVAPTSFLMARILPADTTILVKHDAFVVDEIVRMRAHGYEEWMRIASAPVGTGPYTYVVERSLGPLVAQPWYDGDAVVSTGVVGAGFIDIYSQLGINGGIGPTIVGSIRNSTLWSDVSPRWAIGNLKNIYGYVTDTIGAAFGNPAGAWIKIDTALGVRIGHASTTTFSVNPLGQASFAAGSVTIDANGIYVAPASGGVYSTPNAYRFNAVGAETFGMSGTQTADTKMVHINAPEPVGAFTGARVTIGVAGAYARFEANIAGTPYREVFVHASDQVILQGLAGANIRGPITMYDPSTTNNSITFGLGGTITARGSIKERNRTVPMGEWALYTPVFTGFSLGDGTLTGKYCRIGTTVHFWVLAVLGSTSGVSGPLTVTTPTSFGAYATAVSFARVMYLDASAGGLYDGPTHIVSGTAISLDVAGSPLATAGVGSPFGWQVGDQIYVWGSYEEV